MVFAALSLTSRQRASVAVVAAGAFAVAGASDLRFVMPFGLLLAALGLPLLTVIAGRLRRRLSDPGAWRYAVLAAAAGGLIAGIQLRFASIAPFAVNDAHSYCGGASNSAQLTTLVVVAIVILVCSVATLALLVAAVRLAGGGHSPSWLRPAAISFPPALLVTWAAWGIAGGVTSC